MAIKKPIKNDADLKVPVTAGDEPYPHDEREKILTDCLQHYRWWTDDNLQRQTRTGGWNDISDAYHGVLPVDWPFTSRTTDPRIRTSLLEKNARLTNRKLRGKMLPREGADMIKARINNAIIDFQWDAANEGGSMQTKLSGCDMDSRLYQSKFAYIPWKRKEDSEGELLFEGNEMRPLDIRDCGMDPNCDHIRNAKWFQMREWEPVENIEANKDMYEGYSELMTRIRSDKKFNQNRRDIKWQDRLKQHKGLEDRMGTDPAFPVIEKVTEFREGRWIIFCPTYKVILTVIDNPYDHKKIPIAQLRYYQNDGDNLGEGEVEAVLPMWKAIQAVMCAFLDEVILKMRPPLKIVEGAVRIETIVYEAEAQWLMDNVNAVAEMDSRGDSIRYFNSTYPILVSAFNVAMGDMSQGVSNADPLASDKTATEVRQIAKQQNSRDQKNQSELAEFIKDIVMMWVSNNKQFLFKDPKKQEYILRIIGTDSFEYFKRLGMDEMVVTPEGVNLVQQTLQNMHDTAPQGAPVPDSIVQTLTDAVKVPKYPIIENPEEKDDSKLRIKPKMTIGDMQDHATLTVVPEDLDGLYDYVPDMKSLEASSSDQMIMARTQAVAQLMNPNMLQLLSLQGYKPLVKDLLVANFEDWGLNDASRFFEQIGGQPPAGAPLPGQPGQIPGQPVQPGAPGGFSPTGGTLPNQSAPGMANIPQAPTQPGLDQQMAQPNGLPHA